MQKEINFVSFTTGHKYGIDVSFSIVDLIRDNLSLNLQEMMEGFYYGRAYFEKYNGTINLFSEIPSKTITLMTLSNIMTEGYLGMQLDVDGYTDFQVSKMQDWHNRGFKQYQINSYLALEEILLCNGIDL